MSALQLNRDQYLEFEKLGIGAFRPLHGFMNEDEFHAVVERSRLPGGEVFPLPIVLDVSSAQADRLSGQDEVALVYQGIEVGSLRPKSFFHCDRPAVTRRVFGTDDPRHPGVAHFFGLDDVFVGGAITLKRRVELEFSTYEFLPEQTKAMFAARGWKRVVGFQTRNVPHRAHEHLQRIALEQVDGLFIQPLVGRKKVGDYTPEAILRSYEELIRLFYNPDRVMLGILSTSMRYAGPREAVFHALVRRNYGCTHFIIGRDHAGVGNYYDKYAAHRYAQEFDGELGIEIMYMHGPYHCALCDGVVTEHTCPHPTSAPDAVTEISGTLMRALLLKEHKPDNHLMRAEIQNVLVGVNIFI